MGLHLFQDKRYMHGIMHIEHIRKAMDILRVRFQISTILEGEEHTNNLPVMTFAFICRNFMQISRNLGRQ